MRNIAYTIFAYLSFVPTLFAELSGDEIKNQMIPSTANDVLSAWTASESWQGYLDAILAFVRDSIFALMALVAVGMFLFIGARLALARWNAEEFKKAMMSFVYAAVGLFVVALSYALVRFISGVSI